MSGQREDAAWDELVRLIEESIPTEVVVWEAPYSRRYGELDDRDRHVIARGAARAAAVYFGSNVTPTQTNEGE